MSYPLKSRGTEKTYRSVAENGLEREEEEAGFALPWVVCGFLGGAREVVGGLLVEAAARLIAAIAAADATPVWFDTFDHAFPVAEDLADEVGVDEQE